MLKLLFLFSPQVRAHDVCLANSLTRLSWTSSTRALQVGHTCPPLLLHVPQNCVYDRCARTSHPTSVPYQVAQGGKKESGQRRFAEHCSLYFLGFPRSSRNPAAGCFFFSGTSRNSMTPVTVPDERTTGPVTAKSRPTQLDILQTPRCRHSSEVVRFLIGRA